MARGEISDDTDGIPPDPRGGARPGSGHILQIEDDEIEQINLRVLRQRASLQEAASQRARIFVPAELNFELLFFRKIFVELRRQVNPNGDPTPLDTEESIPTQVFQRAFERLFFVLQDPQGFDARVYDANRNGFVGWGEFCNVSKHRKVNVRLSLSERIYLMMDNQESCFLAQVIGWVVLMTIILSSLCFILSTVPRFQVQPQDGSMPYPDHAFRWIERSCLFIFVVEYALRLVTCWSVRHEIFDQNALVELTVGFDPIDLPTAFERLGSFMLAPSNVVDLAAIVPGMVGLFTEMNGGGFVVLRLIRLTRIFRALKHIRGPAMILARTIQSSLKAFFVLAFNLMLLVVISASLMYLAEGGTWDAPSKSFLRSVGREWNETTSSWIDAKAESPFLSIPHAFWWATVTATTVGYGDATPTTSLGFVIATTNMVLSIVILALPVGVIGGSFQKNWQNYDKDLKAMAVTELRETAAITSSIQKIDPMSMSGLMLVEVWNDRFPSIYKEASGNAWIPGPEASSLPSPAEFMGKVMIELELPPHASVVKQMRLPLGEDTDIVNRGVTGHISLRYEWTPHGKRLSTNKEINEEPTTPMSTIIPTPHSNVSDIMNLQGTLQVTLISAERLINLDLHTLNSASNPYCTVLCYPNSPNSSSEIPRPCMWRSPTLLNTLHPQWSSSFHSFEFHWARRKDRRCYTVDSEGGSFALGRRSGDKLADLTQLLHNLGTDMLDMRQQMEMLTERIERLETSAK
eukprot:TRINITY_DN5495_c0_g1_i1.p1 TRINITY_DN5495_c0_g1~~TRINITY_DN5495_c0_g1_i1.p1  ORF type:complete len:747 (+),score=147.92 TRINITY_DN5495_c0_g1_i1:79-2319(+)